MDKVFSELLPNKKKSNILKFCLNNKRLEESGTTNEYSTMLNDVYNYASGVGRVSENAVGNEMRRVLEAYSTFLYREGIESVSTKEEILECMTDSEQEYFESRMYRLVLHGESHSEEKIKTIDDLNFSQFIAPIEKVKTAQDIICFLYALNKVHLRAYLSYHENDSSHWEEIQKTIEKWRQERGFTNIE
jgi:hypothetical protein